MPTEEEDSHRPRFHFVPGQWMNDSIPFFWDGAYHYLFLHNPASVQWSALTNYGHAVSRDLVHWERLPDALVPTPGGPDADGCWTGSIAQDGGTFYLFYTAIPKHSNGPDSQLQCLASSTDLVHWEKYAGNPLPVVQPEGFGDCFRDPLVWKEGNGWRMGVGGALAEKRGGTVFLYDAPNLTDWQYTGLLVECETAKTGHECECPDFFDLGNRWVLISSSDKTSWQAGDYAGGRFTPDAYGLADGGKFYAAKTLLDAKNRRLLLGWVSEDRSEAEQQAAGWSGALSLPRCVTLLPDGAIGFAPVPELQKLRGAHTHFADLSVSDGFQLLDGVQSDSFELLAQIIPGTAQTAGVRVRSAPDGTGGVSLLWDRTSQRFNGVPLKLGPDETLTLHVFVDRSVVEVFVNNRICYTARTYPEGLDCLSVALVATVGAASALLVDIWEMKAI